MPHLAAKFVQTSDALFGKTCREFYESQALQWPFFWAKWWINLNNLGDCQAKQQVQYFLKVSFKNKTSAETLKAMHCDSDYEDPYRMLFFEYGDVKTPYAENVSVMDDSCAVSWTHCLTVREFLMRHIRLSYNMLEKAIDDRMYYQLQKYIATGALNDAQFELLVRKTEKTQEKLLIAIVADYVSRYGITEKYTDVLALDESICKAYEDYRKRVKKKTVLQKNNQ